jgi:hypothetical protein
MTSTEHSAAAARKRIEACNADSFGERRLADKLRAEALKHEFLAKLGKLGTLVSK